MYDVYGRCQEGAPVTIRADAQATASYVASSSIDLFSFGGVMVHPIVGTSAVGTMFLKDQWSLDNSNWGDAVTASVSGAITGGLQPFSVAGSRFSLDMSRAGVIQPRYLPRQGRYYRSAVVWNASTAATLSINALPANNMA